MKQTVARHTAAPPPVDAAPPLPELPGQLEVHGSHRLYVRRTPMRGGEARGVFVHGLAGSATNWTDLMHVLAPYVAGEALDLPGFGWSPEPSARDYSLSSHADAVVALIESGTRPVHVFGNSLGGAVAALVAASRPDLVRSLTLIAPALPNFRPSATAVRIPILLVPGVREVILRRLAATPAEERVRLAVAATYANPDLVHPQRLRDAAAEIRRRAELPYAEEALVRSTRGLIASYASAGTRNLWQVARRVVSPTLLIFGTHDKLVDFRLAARASRTFRNSRLVVLPDVGHVAQMERPSVVVAAVRDFLAALDAGRTSESGNPEHGDRV